MNKFLSISIGVLIVAGIVMVVAFKLLTGSLNKTPTPSTTTTTGSSSYTTNINVGTSGSSQSTGSTTVEGPTIPITTAGGQIIQVRDFRDSPTLYKDPANEGYYYFGYHYSGGVSDPTATENPPYVIEFIASTHYFNITLLQEPIGEARAQAELYLEEYLGISEVQMCQLDYTVTVPNSVSQIYAGKNLGFSFCQGATAL